MPDREHVPCGECVSFDHNRVDQSSSDGVCMARIEGYFGEQEIYADRDADINGCSDLSERLDRLLAGEDEGMGSERPTKNLSLHGEITRAEGGDITSEEAMKLTLRILEFLEDRDYLFQCIFTHPDWDKGKYTDTPEAQREAPDAE